MVAKAITNIDRGCGRRVPGGCYLEVGVGSGGLPVEAFIIDPVLHVSVEQQRALGLAGPRGTMSLGVHLVPRPGFEDVWDVWDVIGEGNYPNVADFLEEARRYGVSRRIANTTDFSKLSPYSRLILLHAKAAVGNWQEMYAADWDRRCPMELAVEAGAPNVQVPETHEMPATARNNLCAGIWWEDVVDGKPVSQSLDRFVQRDMPPGRAQWHYMARRRPDDGMPVYMLGVVAAFPLSRIAVVTDKVGNKHEKGLAAARRSQGLPVEESEN